MILPHIIDGFNITAKINKFFLYKNKRFDFNVFFFNKGKCHSFQEEENTPVRRGNFAMTQPEEWRQHRDLLLT